MELEIKYSTTEFVFHAILLDPAIAPFLSAVEKLPFHAVYYDNENRDLSNLRAALRHRTEGGDGVCTIKFKPELIGDAFLREEYEVDAQNIEEGINKLASTYNLPPIILNVISDTPLFPIASMNFFRTLAYFDNDGEHYMLSFDLGNVSNGVHSVPICEMEIELKLGSAETMLDWAKKLAEKYSLKTDFVSKLQKINNLH